MTSTKLRLYELGNNKDSIVVVAYNSEQALQLIYTKYLKSIDKDPKHTIEWKLRHPMSAELLNIVIDEDYSYDLIKTLENTYTLKEFKLDNPEIIDLKPPKVINAPIVDLATRIRERMPLKYMKNDLTRENNELKLYLLVSTVYDTYITITAYTPEQAMHILFEHYINVARHSEGGNFARSLLKHQDKQFFVYNLFYAVDIGTPLEMNYFNTQYNLLEFAIKEGVLFETRTIFEKRYSREKLERHVTKELEIDSKNVKRINPIPLESIIDRRRAQTVFPVSKNRIQKKIQKMKYIPGGNVNQAHKLWLEKCTDAMMKFTKEELLQAARRVGADVTFKMTKEEICNAINNIFAEPELSYEPEVQGPQPLGGGWVGSRENPTITFKSKHKFG